MITAQELITALQRLDPTDVIYFVSLEHRGVPNKDLGKYKDIQGIPKIVRLRNNVPYGDAYNGLNGYEPFVMIRKGRVPDVHASH